MEEKRPHSGNKYHRVISEVKGDQSITIDVYCVIEAYGIHCPALQHALKKNSDSGATG